VRIRFSSLKGGAIPRRHLTHKHPHLSNNPFTFDHHINFYLMIETETYVSQRERSRSPRRRSRSPGRSTRRRSYSPRSRSRSRDDHRRTERRSRSPMSGQGAAQGGGYGGGAAPHRSFEERAAAREQMMSSVRPFPVELCVILRQTLAPRVIATRPPCLCRQLILRC
jgi:hypothetical protein